jgi:hypothetical protein
VVEALRNIPHTIYIIDFYSQNENYRPTYRTYYIWMGTYTAKYFNKAYIMCYGRQPEAETNLETIFLFGKDFRKERLIKPITR